MYNRIKSIGYGYNILILAIISVMSCIIYFTYVLISTYTISYNKGVVVETGDCLAYCAAKINVNGEILFVKVNSPVMIGQTVLQRCPRGKCREVWVTKEDPPL